MTVPARTPLGASTTNRKWYLDVDSSAAPHTTPVWEGVFGIQEFQEAVEASLQDDTDFDGAGWGSQTKTSQKWSVTVKVARKVTVASPTAYDPGQELLRLASDQNGVANTMHIRFYEMEPNGPRVEAYDGLVAVAYAPDGGGVDALSTATITLSGQGPRNSITHPAP